ADVSIYCYSGSYAEEYAKTHNIECHLLDTGEVIPAAMSGDANGDGVRNLKDVLALRKALADGTESALSAGADCNGDGEVNMKDVLMLRQHLAGLFV
ncbi:MAG: dockerin type I repeat-containing protein, partial [Clostridia bacterium]|nr:dockerin type I repeat-containing protein [Clostridia bacterium]